MALEEVLTHFGFTVDSSKLKEADRGVGSIIEKLGGIGGLIKGAAIGFIGKEVFDTIKDTISEVTGEIGALRKQSAQLNVTTDFLEQYGYAAKLSGVSQEGFSIGLRKLSIGLGNTGDSAQGTGEIFKRLGISTKDALTGKVKSAGEILPELIDNFQKIPKGAEQSAAAVKLFGRGGVEMVPFLNKGKAAVGELIDEFELLHGSLSAQTLKDVGEYRKNMARLQTANDGLKLQMVSFLIPALAKFFGYMAFSIGHFRKWAESIDLFGHLGRTALVGLLAALLPIAPAILEATIALAPWVIGWALAILAVDDFIGFMKGEDSVIGGILDGWFGEGTASKVRGWFLDLGVDVDNFWADFQDGAYVGTSGAMGSFATFFADAGNGFRGLRATVSAIMAGLVVEFQTDVLLLESAWNEFIGKLHLPANIAAGLQIDQGAQAGRLAAAQVDLAGKNQHIEDVKRGEQTGVRQAFGQTGAVERFVDLRNNLNGKDSVGNDGAPATTLSQGPVRAPITTTNYVETNPVVNVTVPPGTSDAQARAVARAARDGVRTGTRSALGALESTK